MMTIDNISKEFTNAIAVSPSKNSTLMTIFTMCNMIKKGEISLPLYQRDVSWTIDKCISLLNYQLLAKAPVAPISMNIINDVNKSVPQISFIDRDIISGIQRGQHSIVDGQQRLTTNYKAYINHDDFRNIVLDLSKGKFIKTEKYIDESQIPVGVLLNESIQIFLDYANKVFSPEITNILLMVRNKIRDYNYTINSASDLSEDEQIEWFEVLNNAGSRVSHIQMKFSQLKANGFDIYKDYTKYFVDRIISAGYNNFLKPKTTDVSYPIAALNPILYVNGKIKTNYAPISSDTQQALLSKSKVEDLKLYTQQTLMSENIVIEFIKDNHLKNPDRIDYINYLIGYFVFNSKKSRTLSEWYSVMEYNEKNNLIKWYNNVDFTNKSNSERRAIYTDFITKKFR